MSGELLVAELDEANARLSRTIDEQLGVLHAGIDRVVGERDALLAALKAIDAEATNSKPSSRPTVGLPPGFGSDVSEYVTDIVRQAFYEGALLGRWEVAQIARAAIARATPTATEG